MASSKNYNFKVDLTEIEKDKKGCFDWKNSIGRFIPFECDKFSGELEILNYEPKRKNNNAKLTVRYGKFIGKINTTQLRNAQLSGLLKDFLFEWGYDIGDVIIAGNSRIEIIDRKYIDKQTYRIRCVDCGYDGKNNYNVRSKKIENELWFDKYDLNNGFGKCPICNKNNYRLVLGHNDIATTDPWMINFFKDKEVSKTHTARSNDHIWMICPDCGNERKYSISDLKQTGYLPCECRDNISMPNKISYYTLKSLCEKDVIYNYQREYQPQWIKPYRYDNYFEYNNKKYIIEMDGALGHGNLTYSGKTDREGKQRDMVKDKKAKENNVIVYRIDCVKKKNEDILEDLVDVLTTILNKEVVVNKKDILLKSTKSMVKKVCDLYNDGMAILDISNAVDLSTSTVISYLHRGDKLGLCEYTTINENRLNMIGKVKSIIDSNENITAKEISEALGCKLGTVHSYASCLDDKYREALLRNGAISKGEKCGAANSKQVYVYDLKGNYINTYTSQNEIERRSLEDFGIELKSRAISRVCTGERKQYKGYIFSSVPLHK